MAQGLLPFQYESEAGEAGLTGLAGLPLYLELWRAAGLDEAVARHVAVSGAQGWSDRQMVSALGLCCKLLSDHRMLGLGWTGSIPPMVVTRNFATEPPRQSNPSNFS